MSAKRSNTLKRKKSYIFVLLSFFIVAYTAAHLPNTVVYAKPWYCNNHPNWGGCQDTPTPSPTRRPTRIPSPTQLPKPTIPPAIPCTDRDYCVFGLAADYKVFPDYNREWQIERSTKLSKNFTAGDYLAYRSQYQNKIAIKAAGNEYESFQAVIQTKIPLENVGFSVSDLNGPGNAKISADNIEVFSVEYINIPPTPPKASPIDDRTWQEGAYPDPLWPLKPGEKISIPGSSIYANKPLWFRVYIPPATPAGKYTGRITIAPANAPAKTLPIELTVWNFSLPAVPSRPNVINLGSLINQHHHVNNNPTERAKVVDLYYKEFEKARVSPFLYTRPFAQMGVSIGIEMDADNNISLTNLDEFDRLAEKYLPRTAAFPLPKLGFGGDSKMGDKITVVKNGRVENITIYDNKKLYTHVVQEYLRQLSAHLKTKGWWDKAYVFLGDETPESFYPTFKEIAKAIKGSGTGIKTLLATYQNPSLDLADCSTEGKFYRCVDIWVMYNAGFSEGFIKQNFNNADYWVYGPYEYLYIQRPAIEARLTQWFTWQRHGEGFLYYYANAWQSGQWVSGQWEAGSHFKGNVWIDGKIVEAGRFFSPGNGYLFYPPCKQGPCASPVTDRVVPTIRWELLREGIEDYEYFLLLSKLKAAVPQAANALAKVQHTVTANNLSNRPFEDIQSNYLDIRNEIGSLISSNSDKLPPSPTTPPSACDTSRDLNCDGSSNITDLVYFWQLWINQDPRGNIGQDGESAVNIADYIALVRNILEK